MAQAEAPGSTNSGDFEVNYAALNAPQSLFEWISSGGRAWDFPNSIGVESSHADQVAACLYGPNSGVAPGLAHVDNYQAQYLYNNVILTAVPIEDAVVNQSFTFSIAPPSEEPVDQAYDNYIARYGTVFCSAVNGVNNNVGPPGTAYNCIGVGAYGNGVTVYQGPTLDNGRCKPDIVAPGTAISFTTPYVAGAAAVLLQGAMSGASGTNISAASDVRTIKALLLNGAIKPFDWINSPSVPLDYRYGAGVLNLYYSYQQLVSGQQGYTSQAIVPAGAPHPPIDTGLTAGSWLGWDLEAIAGNNSSDTVCHYLFGVSSNSTFTTTLVWERLAGVATIDNLALFLYDATNGALVASSVSKVDNVQHIYIPHLALGIYDLEVVIYARASPEVFALAFQFFPLSPPRLTVQLTGNNLGVSWPWSPTVYTLQQASSLGNSANWSNVSATQWITNSVVLTSINDSGGTAYFRLAR